MEQAVSAPMCTRVLADFGARVIKVENPKGGDFARDYDDVVNGLAAHFVWANRGKESVTLDLKSDAGMDVLHRLLDRADALVSNLAPGATARLGIGPERPAAPAPRRHPRRDRRLRPRRAHLAQARLRPAGAGRVGACAVTGYPGMPAKPGPPVADISTGLYAALSILALLLGRARGRSEGPAPAVAVSLFDTMTDIMGYQLTYTQHSGIDQQPLGMSSPAVAPYGAFPTRDGQTVVLGTTNDREWQRVAREIIERPDLADDPRFAQQHRPLRVSATSSTPPSKPGARSTISPTSRRSPTPPGSATRGTTCPARSSRTRNCRPATAGVRSTPPTARSRRCCRRR